MANPSKQKGTGAETELVRLLSEYPWPGTGRRWTRTSPGMNYDVHGTGSPGLELPPILALATRPDRGRWLVTVSLDDFAHLLFDCPREVHVEVKRYTRFALHSIWEKKFG